MPKLINVMAVVLKPDETYDEFSQSFKRFCSISVRNRQKWQDFSKKLPLSGIAQVKNLLSICTRTTVIENLTYLVPLPV